MYDDYEDLIEKKCPRCKEIFKVHVLDNWKRICLACWKKEKRAAESFSSRSSQQTRSTNNFDNEFEAKIEINRLKMELRAKELELQMTKMELFSAKRQQPASRNSQFTPEELKRLRMLCHPDRHGNSELSNKMTKKLNEILNQ